MTAERTVPIVTGELAEAIRDGSLDHYHPGKPRRGAADGATIDETICADSDCTQCGQHGLEYRPFVDMDSRYRAFCVCPQCGDSEEF